MPVSHPAPVPCAGAVLAGGAGRRIGGDKAAVAVAGRPLLEHALRTLARVASPVAVVARAETVLPELPGPPVPRWIEPDGPRHPLVGVVHALEQARGRPVLVCAVDLPLMDPATLRVLLIAAALAPDAPAVVPRTGKQLQVLCALYRPAALAGLRGFDPDARAQDVVAALGPALVPFPDESPFFNVNRPEDVQEAEARLAARERRR
jgi:molybdopterin-guanine dinucleotide biosynthesis protein A